ncbi:MAG: nitrilase-related carbon-nitrogen hydrolase [Actinomycetota bacterium]|nr:nitrilase-related carbon-nitrogen hydrolase [Actinomycetota bacterium]
MSVSVALLQLEVSSSESPESRSARVLNMIPQAAASAQFLVLPELWHVGAHDLEAARTHAQSIDGPLARQLSAAARAQGIWLHAGSIVERDAAGNLFNTSLLFAPNGDLAASYRKMHLFGFDTGESALMSAGNELVQTETTLGRTGLTTCYDLRFPELFRALCVQGVEAVVVTSGWPSARIEQWSVLLRARAIENQCWVIACNETGLQNSSDGPVQLGGCSAVINPLGEVVAQGGVEECLVFASVDMASVHELRESFPVLRDIKLANNFKG